MTRLHLATLQHEEEGIEDQVQFIADFAQEWGVELSIAQGLSSGCLNLVAEGIDRGAIVRLRNTSRALQAPICMIATENWFLDDSGEVSLNGQPCLGARSQVEGALIPSLRLEQMINLALISDMVICLGGTPAKRDLMSVLPQHMVLSLGYPALEIDQRRLQMSHDTDLFFSVPTELPLTRYRKRIIDDIRSTGVSVNVGKGLALKEWIEEARRSRAVLDIAQYPEWSWESPMRVMRAMRANRPVVSLREVSLERCEWGFPFVQYFRSVKDLTSALPQLPEIPPSLYAGYRKPLDTQVFVSRLEWFDKKSP